jgi:alcohol dehydrogenase (cytochrome c)
VLALDPKTESGNGISNSPRTTRTIGTPTKPMLVDLPFRGSVRKPLIQANRNAFYYVLDRETGQFLHGKAFAHQTWATGLDDQATPS